MAPLPNPLAALPDPGSWNPAPSEPPEPPLPPVPPAPAAPPPAPSVPPSALPEVRIAPRTVQELRAEQRLAPFARYPRLHLGDVRHNCGVSLKTILREIGCSQQTYTYIERGVSNPNFLTICKLARFFQLSVDELFGDLIERLAPGYRAAVERGQGDPSLPPPPTPPDDDFDATPFPRLISPRYPKPQPPHVSEPPEGFAPPPPPPDFLRSLVEDFAPPDSGLPPASESAPPVETGEGFFDPFAQDGPGEL